MPKLPPIWAVAVGLLLSAGATHAQSLTGEQIFKKTCASCHGAQGEGVKGKYEQALAGDKSVAQLAKLIAKTMPEDDPGSCAGELADKVAEYIFEAFYSKAARDRNAPPRIELARLTVKQYRNALADLVGSFRPPMKPDAHHGLKGEYFNSRGFQNNKRSIDRLDPEVKFDFGTAAPDPDPEKFDPYQFAIRWTGSVIADETGTYEFVVKTDQAARLWVNDPVKPLIDAWVKSGSDTEFRQSIFLLAGRAYPIRLEFSKAKQGVDDTKKLKEKPKVSAFVALEWKPPAGAAGVIPSRNLIPTEAPETYISSVPFPPDDKSYGWVRGTTISKAWDSATTDAALDAAAYLAIVADELAGVSGSDRRRKDMGSGNPAGINLDSQGGVVAVTPERIAKLKTFARQFAERAFRRPISDDLAKIVIDRPFDSAKDPAEAIKRIVLFVLKSPRFLYRETDATPDGYDVAARLSFGLWDSIPDQELFAAAKAGKLSTRDEVVKQAERMLKDHRAHAKLHEFLHSWLKVDRPLDLAKDPKKFPKFDPAVIGDLRSSLDLGIDDVLDSPGADFRRLLLDEDVFLNDRLAGFYGGPKPDAPGFQKVKLDPGHRAGVLSHPYLLAAYAYTGETSPIHRGVFLARGILGVALRPPPEAVAPLSPDLHPGLTTRERVTLQTTPNACLTCHAVINPLGFTLENFDAVGRYRELEHAKPVDASGSYQTRTGETKKFQGVRELAKFLAESEEVHASFTEQLVHHLVQQPVRAYGTDALEKLRQSFAANGFDVKKLAVEIMANTALAPRVQKPANPPVK
jgi:hypothetical protein